MAAMGHRVWALGVAAGGAALLALATAPRAVAGSERVTPAPETHCFHVKGYANYRCYGGYGPAKVTDPRTGFVCDNKTYEKVLVDTTVEIVIKNEPNPAGDLGLAGGWQEKKEFMGRTFFASVVLFKEAPPGAAGAYRLRMLALDEEQLSRRATTHASFEHPRSMNTIGVSYQSWGGGPVELTYDLSVSPAPKAVQCPAR